MEREEVRKEEVGRFGTGWMIEMTLLGQYRGFVHGGMILCCIDTILPDPR